MPISRIISGGQTGVDRAALDAAIELGLRHGGWVPQNRAAEDGEIDPRYEVKETPDSDPRQRTEWNVRDSDATLIVSRGELVGGSALTRQFTLRYAKPSLHVDLSVLSIEEAAATIIQWLASIEGGTLNVAGPRASEDNEIYRRAKTLLAVALQRHRPDEIERI